MKKIKILSLLMALLLSSSLLLASCGSKKDKETESESETEPVVEEVELTKYGIADIMNASYAPNVENGVISAIKDPASYKGAFYNNEMNYIITLDNENEKLYVYNTANDKGVELEHYAEKLNTAETKASFKLNYVDVISEDYFAVLTMAYTEDANYYGDYSYSSDWVGIPDNDYKNFYNGNQAYCTYTLTVYGSDAVAVKTYSNAELYSRCQKEESQVPDVWESLRDNYTSQYTLYKFDLYKKDDALYRASYADGKLKYDLVKEYGVAKIPTIDSKSGDYYLYSDSKTYTVYNKDLSVAYSYTVTSDSSYVNTFILANGSLLVQYRRVLDQDEKNFDYRYGSDTKYDLVTLVVNADGTKELEGVDYWVHSLKASVADERGNKEYSDKVTNLAFICPIAEDKTLDTGLGNRKLVLLSNDCEITAEVEIASNMTEFPTVVEKGFYGVETVGSGIRSQEYDPLLGTVYIYTLKFDLYNAEGKFVNAYESKHKVPYSMYNSGVVELPLVLEKYTVTDKGVYDINNALIYDAKKNNAKIETVGDAIYVMTYGDGTEVYSLFLGADNLVTIGTKVIGSDANAADVANKIESFEAKNGYYATFVEDKETSKCKATYYNVKGEAIASVEEKGTNYNVRVIEISDELVIFYETYRDQGGKVVNNYYKAPIVK